MSDFGSRLQGVFDSAGRLCVGIDPHAELLAGWGLDDSADGARELGLRVVDAVAGRAGMVKPQVAFFERHGSRGYAALEDVLAAARSAGLLVIADVKRGDVGSTVDAYGEAWLTPGSPLEADAMTAVAYQGVGSLETVLTRAAAAEKGIFVLAATSNPEGVRLQRALRDDGHTVAAGIVDDVRSLSGGGELASVGVVIGATVRMGDYGIADSDLSGVPILAPGFGAQGAQLTDVQRLFGSAASGTVVNVARSVLQAGPDGLPDAIERARDEADR